MGGNSSLVVFLGAGASAFAGYGTFQNFPGLLLNEEMRARQGLTALHPTTAAFLREVRDTLVILGKPTTHDHFLWALADYRNLWRLLRIDDVLHSRFVDTAIEWAQFAHFAQLVDDAVLDITETTVSHYSANLSDGEAGRQRFEAVARFYQDLALINNADEPFLEVFTTNYDCWRSRGNVSF